MNANMSHLCQGKDCELRNFFFFFKQTVFITMPMGKLEMGD